MKKHVFCRRKHKLLTKKQLHKIFEGSPRCSCFVQNLWILAYSPDRIIATVAAARLNNLLDTKWLTMQMAGSAGDIENVTKESVHIPPSPSPMDPLVKTPYSRRV